MRVFPWQQGLPQPALINFVAKHIVPTATSTPTAEATATPVPTVVPATLIPKFKVPPAYEGGIRQLAMVSLRRKDRIEPFVDIEADPLYTVGHSLGAVLSPRLEWPESTHPIYRCLVFADGITVMDISTPISTTLPAGLVVDVVPW
jgi:hypothetical protein